MRNFLSKLTLSLTICLIAISNVASAQDCAEVLSQVVGARFLHAKNGQLHTSKPVEAIAQKYKNETGITLTKPADKLAQWMNYLEHLNSRAQNDPLVLNRIKEFYYKSYVTQNIPQSYYDLQVRIAREQGHGNIVLNNQTKKQMADILIRDQKQSLDQWIEYFVSSDSSSYPTWAKFWVFNSVLKLSKFDPESGHFGHRDGEQVAPFPELNREALAIVMDAMVKHLQKSSLNEIQDPTFRALLNEGSFAKIYGKFLADAYKTNLNNHGTSKGQWVTFPQNSDHLILVNSLKGQNTGWCTAGEETAKIQLGGGDFHIYYTQDSKGKPTVPRLAIRMEGENIAEVRGVGKNQNIDSQIASTDILKQKLKDFGQEGERYNKRSHDMKFLTNIENKIKLHHELYMEDLRFLYEVDGTIEGFGYKKDPRILEIISKRNIRRDLSEIYSVAADDISLTLEEALRGRSKIHYGNLYLNNTSAQGLTLPRIIHGDLSLDLLNSAEGLILPHTINGGLSLIRLTSTKGLSLPHTINGDLNLDSLTSAAGLTLPETINGGLSLIRLLSAKGLTLPRTINGYLNLNSLTSTDGLTLPQTINGGLSLSRLSSAKGLVLPQTINGRLNLSSLTSTEGLILPHTINGDLRLDSLTSADGLTFPQTVNGDLNLAGLTSAEGLILPHTINGDLLLFRLTSVIGLTLPQTINGGLNLAGLTSAEGLILPQTIKGYFNLADLTSAKGLTFPQTINGDLNLRSLTSAEGITLPQTINGDLNLRSLTYDKGITLPQTIHGNLILYSLTFTEGLILPSNFTGNIYIKNSIKNRLILPRDFKGNIFIDPSI